MCVNSAFNNIENELAIIVSTLLQLEKDIIDTAIRIHQREIAEAKARATAIGSGLKKYSGREKLC
jgi:hypothetical protein